MKSIIFCYRDTNQPYRWDQLNVTIPRIKELLKDSPHQIVVVEQDDDLPFRRGNLLNEGVLASSGEIVVLSDIDYYPKEVEYWEGNTDVFLPVKKVQWVNNDLTPVPEEQIPSGYRHFKDGVDENFHGGVIAFKRQKFLSINGFNPLYVGWGLEDADLRERIAAGKLRVKRSKGNIFYALNHPDTGAMADLNHNNQVYTQWQLFREYGVNTQRATRKDVQPRHPMVDLWIKATEFQPI